MCTSVYDKIEKDIKQSDYYMRENFAFNILYIVLLVAISATVPIIVLYNYIGWIALASELILSSFCFEFIKFKIVYAISNSTILDSINSIGKLKKSDFLNFSKIDKMAKVLKKEKPAILFIIKKYGIATKDGLEEVIAHYRFKANSSKQLPIDFLAVFASVISIISLFIKGEIDYANQSTIIVAFILIAILLIYIAVIYTSRVVFAQYGKKSFYTRIECELSEIRALNKLTTRGRKKKNEEITDNDAIKKSSSFCHED